ncbi:alpha/beta fold hydrolase [Actinomadura sp. 9N215]|uniref:alpha/beta fold hydrolase n=1 Tax=Actinomadura sp. 9N215 TaxID=3375150 RepID=UPI0037A0557D
MEFQSPSVQGIVPFRGLEPVVHYDQLGNGKSTHLPDWPADFWSVALFLAELDNLLDGLKLSDEYVLFGHSWGGMLAAAHAARRPRGLRRLVIANSPASMPLRLKEAARLRSALPPDVQQVLLRHEAAGTTDSAEYLEAVGVYYERHVCRLPWPLELKASYLEIHTDPTVYYTMNGPNEFHVIGSLKDWSVIDLLPRIETPTLVLSGRHDEASPETTRPLCRTHPGRGLACF